MAETSVLRDTIDSINHGVDQLSTGEAIAVGTVDISLGALMLTNTIENADLASTVVEYALAKPTGIALAAFGVYCLATAAKRIVTERQ